MKHIRFSTSSKHMRISCLLLLSIIFLCQPVLAGNRWMAGLTGSKGLGEWAPRYAAGVEVSCFLLESGAFRIGPGLGAAWAEERVVYGTEKMYAASLYLPVFVRGVFSPDLGGRLKPFVALDAGYLFDLLLRRPKLPGSIDAFFFTPQVGLDFGEHLYASVGAWCQGVVRRREPMRYDVRPSLVLKLGFRW